MTTTTTSTEERALALLGQGVAAEMVASAVGVSVSRISQLAADPEFAAKVATIRFENLSKHNERDNKYDRLEDSLVDRMESMIPMMYKPGEILKAIQVINAAKRRGSSEPNSILGLKEVVSLTMPTVLLNQFSQNVTVNIHNQVIKAGEQDLVTVQSVRMTDLLNAQKSDALTKQKEQVEYYEESIKSMHSGSSEESGAGAGNA